jgi:ParB-like chromosome segregation protein Spo0J
MKGEHMALYAIKDIKANPFRHIARYPIRREKVAALRESLRKTGFWDNVVARAKDGKAEIAYGHHRLVALKEEYGPNHKVELIIRKLDDEAMIQIMARENMEEWGTSASVEQETIRAVVEAYGEGLITLPSVSKDAKKSQTRYAPSFIPGDADDPRARADRP